MPEPAARDPGVPDPGGHAHVLADRLDDLLTVTGPTGRHLARVRRLRAGEVVTATDGRGSLRPYRVTATGRDDLTLEAIGPGRHEAPLVPPIAVAFCLTKGDKPQLAVQKLTELGVDRIVPVVGRRSIVRWDGAQAAAAHERWTAVAAEAVMQCRRTRVPVIETVAPLVSLAGHPHVIVADRDGDITPGEWIGRARAGGEVLLVVGPEGGLEPAELEALAPADRLSVAPTVLRAETAAIAAAAVLVAARWHAQSGQNIPA